MPEEWKSVSITPTFKRGNGRYRELQTGQYYEKMQEYIIKESIFKYPEDNKG